MFYTFWLYTGHFVENKDSRGEINSTEAPESCLFFLLEWGFQSHLFYNLAGSRFCCCFSYIFVCSSVYFWTLDYKLHFISVELWKLDVLSRVFCPIFLLYSTTPFLYLRKVTSSSSTSAPKVDGILVDPKGTSPKTPLTSQSVNLPDDDANDVASTKHKQYEGISVSHQRRLPEEGLHYSEVDGGGIIGEDARL